MLKDESDSLSLRDKGGLDIQRQLRSLVDVMEAVFRYHGQVHALITPQPCSFNQSITHPRVAPIFLSAPSL